MYAGQVEIDQIEQAVSVLNVAELKNIAKNLEGYDLALANYRIALSANLTKQDDKAGDALDESMSQLELLNKQQPSNVEVKALLAQVYGYKIALNPIKGMYYGPKAQNMLAQAEELDPNNPRVLLIKGISAANTPTIFGGSEEEALLAFGQAISAYEDDQYSNYHWGFAEAYTWRGIINYKLDNKTSALADWQQALVVEPSYGWAKSLIEKVQ